MTTSDDLQVQIDAKNALLTSITAQLQVVINANPKPSYSIDGQEVDWTTYYKFLMELQKNEIASMAALTSLQQRVPGGLSFFLSSSGGAGCNNGC